MTKEIDLRGHVWWVEGIIGCGKSTLTARLAKATGLRAIHEPVDTNPYLQPFYQAMDNVKPYTARSISPESQAAWWQVHHTAYAMQIYLLQARFALQKLAVAEALTGKGAILDRGLPGDRVFAKMLQRSGHIREQDWKTYDAFYRLMTNDLRPPSLIIFLDVDPRVAFERVKKRDRAAEKSGVTLDYLKALNAGYLDMLADIESGRHVWSRGMHVMRWPWNSDDEPIDELIEQVQLRCKLVEAEG
jgi:deoxyadenosine/deoxycytidine kinase